jgi:hypothetical protein
LQAFCVEGGGIGRIDAMIELAGEDGLGKRPIPAPGATECRRVVGAPPAVVVALLKDRLRPAETANQQIVAP